MVNLYNDHKQHDECATASIGKEKSGGGISGINI